MIFNKISEKKQSFTRNYPSVQIIHFFRIPQFAQGKILVQISTVLRTLHAHTSTRKKSTLLISPRWVTPLSPYFSQLQIAIYTLYTETGKKETRLTRGVSQTLGSFPHLYNIKILSSRTRRTSLLPFLILQHGP